jgi:hypothetical protein
MNEDKDFREELERIRGVADMLTTAHARLRDRHQRLAVGLDVAALAVSTWLTAVVFVEPRINLKLTPHGLEFQVWVGLLGIATFFLSVVQLRVDWKGRSEAHKRSFEMYSEVKRECSYLLASKNALIRENCERVLARYDVAAEVGTPIPERQFLIQKRNHQRKVAMSRYLDQHPGTWFPILRLKMWWYDNFRDGWKR